MHNIHKIATSVRIGFIFLLLPENKVAGRECLELWRFHLTITKVLQTQLFMKLWCGPALPSDKFKSVKLRPYCTGPPLVTCGVKGCRPHQTCLLAESLLLMSEVCIVGKVGVMHSTRIFYVLYFGFAFHMLQGQYVICLIIVVTFCKSYFDLY